MDKEIEYNRYNEASKLKLAQQQESLSNLKDGSGIYAKFLNAPYIYYEEILKEMIKPDDKVLDLCCGDGIHTFFIAKLGATITAVDIAENSIKLATIKAFESNYNNITFIADDIESIAFPFGTKFNYITCVGSLSYVDINIFMEKVKNLLENNGKLIIIDSFNHNPIYKLNRYVHYLRGKRSRSTLKRMPNEITLRKLSNNFKNVNVRYFGIFSFLGFILIFIIGDDKTKKLLDYLDKRFYFLNKYSFKFVAVAERK